MAIPNTSNLSRKSGTTPTQLILGIDPALRCTGYGLLKSDGHDWGATDCGVIKTAAKEPLSECLRRLAGGIEELVTVYRPDMAAIEGGFYSRNAKTAMLLGSARGVVISILAKHAVPVYEYSPRRVKQAVCGYGNADKAQIAALLAQLLSIDIAQLRLDATDALAVAICHANTFFTNQGIFLPTPL